MGGMSLWHWIIVLVIVMLLFGSGRLSAVMGDAAKGIKAFKKGMAEDDTPPARLPEAAPPAYAPPPPYAAPPAYAPNAQPAPAMNPAPGTEPRQP